MSSIPNSCWVLNATIFCKICLILCQTLLNVSNQFCYCSFLKLSVILALIWSLWLLKLINQAKQNFIHHGCILPFILLVSRSRRVKSRNFLFKVCPAKWTFTLFNQPLNGAPSVKRMLSLALKLHHCLTFFKTQKANWTNVISLYFGAFLWIVRLLVNLLRKDLINIDWNQHFSVLFQSLSFKRSNVLLL